MIFRNSDQEWEKFGRKDPYFGVLSDNKFHKDKLNEDSLREFFKSGQEHIDFVLETIRANLVPGFYPSSALDFGCGVGRCSIPLANICKSVVGIDVSDSMLQQARKNCSEQSISNLELRKSDDTLSNISGPFDLIHSFIVFQHITQKRGEKIITRLVELLSENGVGVLQFLYYREESALIGTLGILRKKVPLWHNFINLLYRQPFSQPLMEKNVYNLNQILSILHRQGCDNIHMKFHGSMKHKHQSIMLFFQKKQEKIPYYAFDAY